MESDMQHVYQLAIDLRNAANANKNRNTDEIYIYNLMHAAADQLELLAADCGRTEILQRELDDLQAFIKGIAHNITMALK